MPLVSYPSDSDDDSDDKDAANSLQAENSMPSLTGTKRKLPEESTTLQLPPLPTSFHDLYAANVRTASSDDPSLHGGRKRQTPHVQGNWPTHVYLEWHPQHEEAEVLQSIITRITSGSAKVHTLLQSELKAPLPLHISLSRSLMLRTDAKDEFLSRIRSNMKTVAVKPFSVHFGKLAWYPNYERNRWFLSLSARRADGDELNRLLGAFNAACASMEQPELYVSQKTAPPRGGNGKKRRKSTPAKAGLEDEIPIPDCSDSFHISLAWSLDPQSLGEGNKDVAPGELKDISTSFDCVKVKIGNGITSLPLASSKSSTSSRGLLG
jgi:hypothetical protein